MTHLNALQLGLSHERCRLASAKTANERALRSIWVRQLEKEIADEPHFAATPEMSDDELLSALSA